MMHSNRLNFFDADYFIKPEVIEILANTLEKGNIPNLSPTVYTCLKQVAKDKKCDDDQYVTWLLSCYQLCLELYKSNRSLEANVLLAYLYENLSVKAENLFAQFFKDEMQYFYFLSGVYLRLANTKIHQLPRKSEANADSFLDKISSIESLLKQIHDRIPHDELTPTEKKSFHTVVWQLMHCQGMLHFAQEEHEKALAFYSECEKYTKDTHRDIASVSESDKCINLFYMAACYMQLKKFDEAMLLLNQLETFEGSQASDFLIKILPERLYYSGICYFVSEQYEDALLAFQESKKRLQFSENAYAIIQEQAVCCLAAISQLKMNPKDSAATQFLLNLKDTLNTEKFQDNLIRYLLKMYLFENTLEIFKDISPAGNEVIDFFIEEKEYGPDNSKRNPQPFL